MKAFCCRDAMVFLDVSYIVAHFYIDTSVARAGTPLTTFVKCRKLTYKCLRRAHTYEM